MPSTNSSPRSSYRCGSTSVSQCDVKRCPRRSSAACTERWSYSSPFCTTPTLPSALRSGWSPRARSMLASRRAASATGPSAKTPSLSGPRCTIASAIARTARSSTAPPSRATMPQMPHTASSSPPHRRHVAGPALQHAVGRRDDQAEVEADRAVGQPLEVVGQLLRPAHVARHPQLSEARQPRAHDEPLPVLRDLLAELLEEHGADRPRPDQRHVAAHHVPQLRQLVEVHRAQPAPDAGELVDRPAIQRRRLVGAEPRLRVRLQRPQLVHREHPPGAPDAQPAVEDRPARRHEDQQHQGADQRRGRDEQRAGDHEVERAHERVERAVLVGMEGLRGVALGDRLRARELLRPPALGRVGRLRRRRARRAQAQHHRTAPSMRSTRSCGSRRWITPAPSRLTSSIARGSDSGRSRPSRISASSTPPSRPPYVVYTGVPSATASRFMVPPADTTRSARAISDCASTARSVTITDGSPRLFTYWRCSSVRGSTIAWVPSWVPTWLSTSGNRRFALRW